MFARITRARRISIRPIQHRHHTHMQTPKRAAISVSFFPHPTTGRRTVVTILHVFFCVGLCVSAVCRVRVCSGPTTVGDRIENVCSICGEHKIDSVRLPARMPPKISCNLQKPMSKQNARQCLRGHIPQTLARTRTHAIHPSETFNPSVRRPSCASCQGARPSHIHAHTQTRIHRRSIYVIHCCCFPTYAFYFVGLAIFFLLCVNAAAVCCAPCPGYSTIAIVISHSHTHIYVGHRQKKRIHFRARARAVSPHPSERLPGDWNGCTIFGDFSDRAR